MPRGVPKAGFRNTKKRMAQATEVVMAKATESRFTINQRFEFVGDMVMMLANNIQSSVIVCGPGGLGKSHTVTAALQDAGLNDVTVLDEFEVGAVLDSARSYRVIKGYSTPKGLYRTLYENQDGVVVFDDCDSVLKDPVSLNLLKAALDSYDRRIISWRADMRDEELPQSFEFRGRIIFISNMPSEALDQAIISRSMSVDLSMTTQQKIERMQFLLDQPGFMPEYEMVFKQDALRLIDSIRDSVKELSLRTLIQVVKIRKGAGAKWKDLAEYTIAG
jgi:hypothetical protein